MPIWLTGYFEKENNEQTIEKSQLVLIIQHVFFPVGRHGYSCKHQLLVDTKYNKMMLEYSREDKKMLIVKYLYCGSGNARGNVSFFQLSRTKPSTVS